MASTQLQVVNGKLDNTTYQDLNDLFTTFSQTPEKPIVIYLHGGAIGRKKIEKQIEEYLSVKAFKESDCFPIYILYHSGILEVIVNNVLESFEAQTPQGEEIDGSIDSLHLILKQLSRSKGFTRLFRILAKRALKKIKGDVDKKMALEGTDLPGGLESISSDYVSGTFRRFEEKIDTITEDSVMEEDIFAEVETIERMTELVDAYSIQELDALKEELAEDDEVKQEAEEKGLEDSEGLELIGAKLQLIFLLVNILTRVIKRFIQKTHHGFIETIVEEILRQFAEGPMKQWWATLKSDMDQAFTLRNLHEEKDRETYAGSALLSLLESHWDKLQEGGERKVFLIATSAGTTFLSKFLQATKRQNIDPKVTFHTVFVAPSVTIEEFHENIHENQDRIQSVRIFGLNDYQERNDNVVTIYRNSILFLISGLLENRVATPLLGMERVYSNRRPFQQEKAENLPIKEVKYFLNGHSDFPFVWSEKKGKGPGLNNTGKKHQTIIKDPLVLQSLNEIIRGVEPDDSPENGNIIVLTPPPMKNLEEEGFESISPRKDKKLSFGNQSADPGENPWDKAYAQLLKSGGEEKLIEAEVEGTYTFAHKEEASEEGFESLGSLLPYDTYDPDWPPTGHLIPRVWHLEDDFSELSSAQSHATEQAGGIVRIAHIDTGYDPDHITFPKALIRHDLEQSFVKDEEESGDAHDREKDRRGGLIRQPGHGTGTLGILAGAEIDYPDFLFKGPLGLNQQVEIVPIRIARSVILTLNNKVFARALDYIISLHDDPQTRIHVVSMSMGGLASRVCAELVNQAYEKGIFIVTAAGNNFAKKPARTLVYPARFKRVIAACGITHDYTPYKKSLLEKLTEMQGNYGPRKVMDWAMAAFTPNIPWACSGTGNIISMSGAGTSSATPQIAMAAALYRMKYFRELDSLEGWQQVEATRYALFQAARKSVEGMDDKDFHLHFGQGILQARKALDIAPDITTLQITPPDRIGTVLSFLRMLSGFETTSSPEAVYEMLDLELVQVVQREPQLQDILQDEEVEDFDDLDEVAKQQFVRVVAASSHASRTLKSAIERYYGIGNE